MAGTQIGSFTNFPQGFANGLSIRGMPLLQMQPGQTFFVGNGPVLNPNQKAGSDGNRGTFLDPFSTLNYAINTACVQGRGDIVFVLPGHKEDVPDATTLVMGCAGVAVIGLGAGSLRPQLSLTTASTATVPVRSSNMGIQNVLFLGNVADITTCFTAARASSANSTISTTTLTTVGAVTGTFYPGMSLMGTNVKAGTIILSQLTGVTGGIGTYQVNISQTVTATTITGGPHDFCMDNCEFRDLTATLNIATVFSDSGTTNSVSGLTMNACKISSLGALGTTTAIILTASHDRVSITNNFGNWGIVNDTAAMLATGANSITNFQFGGNRLYRPNTSSTGGSFISTSGGSFTGHCYDNYMYQLDATAGIWIPTGTGLAFSNNFSPITGAADKSGLINPAAV